MRSRLFLAAAPFAALLLSASGCRCDDPVAGPPEPAGEAETPVADEEARADGVDGGDGVVAGGCVDEDGDGIFTGPDCEGPTDCDDADPSVGTAAARACSSGGPPALVFGACTNGRQSCEDGVWSACQGEVLPRAETCDGVDEDCDGVVDNGVVRYCYPGPAGSAGVGVCTGGQQLCVAGAWSDCAGAVLPEQETCDGVDNDCNGSSDENLVRLSFDGDEQAVEPVLLPVDIVVIVDNSCSMDNEISAVESNLNTNFANLIAQSGLDYRVIMLSDFGTGAGQVCIGAPLGGGCASKTACPQNGARFFHYDVSIGSHDALYRILQTFDGAHPCGAPGGWGQWLRPGAGRVFMLITDDGPLVSTNLSPNTYTAQAFEAALFGLPGAPFGTAAQPAFVFHSIVGLKENSPAADPWLPGDPMVQGLCTGNGGMVKTDGWEYQLLSRASSGLRYPLCEYQSFDAVFQTVAAGIVAGARLSCELLVNAVPPGKTMADAAAELTSSDGTTVVPLVAVAGPSACTGDAFYVDGFTIKLCPDACQLWRDDPLAKVDVLFTCPGQAQP